jgi:hypothetical protein
MNGLELFDLINGGAQPVATFHDPFEDFETCIDNKMIGRLVSVERVDEAVFSLNVDLNDWEEHNDQHAKVNYYARKVKEEMVNAKQAGCYPSNGIEKVYLGYDQDLSTSITIHDRGVQTLITIKVTSATVQVTPGERDILMVGTDIPIPLIDHPGNIIMMLYTDEGTGAAWLKDTYGIDAEITDDPDAGMRVMEQQGYDLDLGYHG